MKPRRHPRQQRLRHRRRQAATSDAPRCPQCRAGIELAGQQPSEGLPRSCRQNDSSATTAVVPRLRHKPLRPAAERGPAWRQRRPGRPPRPPATPPQGPAPGSATTPRPPPDGGSPAAAGPACAAPRSSHTACTITPGATATAHPRPLARPPQAPPAPAASSIPPHRSAAGTAATEPAGNTSSRHSSASVHAQAEAASAS